MNNNRQARNDSGIRLRQTGVKFEIRAVAEIVKKIDKSTQQDVSNLGTNNNGNVHSLLNILKTPLSLKNKK